MLLNSGIYQIQNLVNRKVYIGSAVNFNKRWAWHVNSLRLGKHHSILLQRAWDKYGEEAFVFEMLEYTDRDRLITREQFWMDCLKAVSPDCGYNICPVAGSPGTGRVCSAETREKLRITSTGRRHTAETLAKMSRVQTGRTFSDETRALMSANRKGRPGTVLSAEGRASISAAQRGRAKSPETCAKISVANKGRVQPVEERARRSATMTGKKRSPEARANMSKAQKGRTFTDETKLKMSIAAKNRKPPSDEARRAMSEAQLRRNLRERSEG